MGFLVSLAANLIEKLVVFVAALMTRLYQEKKEIDQDKKKVEENLDDLKKAKDQDERRQRAEDLLNNN